jgi:hypothetical protein
LKKKSSERNCEEVVAEDFRSFPDAGTAMTNKSLGTTPLLHFHAALRVRAHRARFYRLPKLLHSMSGVNPIKEI